MIAFIQEQDARLCDRALCSQHFSYVGRGSENWLKQAVLVTVVSIPKLKALSSLVSSTLCSKQLLLRLPACPLAKNALP